MSIMSTLRSLWTPGAGTAWSGPPVQLMADEDTIAAFLGRVTGATTTRAYTPPSVDSALGVPSIQRAVSLISSTVGMLSMQGFRNGEVMDGVDGRATAPRMIVRPDPYHTPQWFYSRTASSMAKWGEFVWWIAARDTDGLPASLVVVPLTELRVQDNPANRLLPTYQWGTITGTRYSAANPSGVFVHETYPLGEPLELRGRGPLQMCGAATSISVESDAWAANFYGHGGWPREIIRKKGTLDPTLRDPVTYDEDPVNGLSEADILRAQYVARVNNTPLVADDSIEYDRTEIDAQGAQMLEGRLHQRGDTALMFSLPGHFVEYVQSGSSLTYQNLEMAFTELIKTCVQPLYLEPIEQAMSDLLTRSTTARFNVKGFLRADIKTRFEVHGIAIDKGIYGPDYAQREEGILPGDVEFAPVPFAAPQAVPDMIPRAASKAVDDRPRVFRCGNAGCHRKMAEGTGKASGWCRHCQTWTEWVAA